MEIKKFEAYKYKGPDLMNLSRSEFIEQLIDNFIDAKIGGYECNGSSYYHNKEELWLFADKKSSDDKSYIDHKIIKIDLSDIGIEIGDAEWDDENEEFKNFIPEVNLNSNITKQIKDYKKDIKGYNL